MLDHAAKDLVVVPNTVREFVSFLGLSGVDWFYRVVCS
jgi:hypothetical protein